MTSIKITGLDELRRNMGEHARQVPYAAMSALNQTAYEVRPIVQHEMRDSFDRPTPYTINSVIYEKATKDNLEARIGIKADPDKGIAPEKYLKWEIEGGTRHLKRFEKALRTVDILPSNHFAIPASGAKIDAYGNMSGGQIVQILSFFQAFPEAGYKANMTEKGMKRMGKSTKNRPGIQYFVSDGRKMAKGIYARFKLAHGNAIKPVLLFVERAHYEQRFDFFYAAQRAAQDRIGKNLSAALSRAIATAR